MGAPDDVIDKARQEAASADFELWDVNWPAYRFFCSLSTQWNYVGGAGMVPIGLDYSAVLAKIGFEVSGKARQRKLFERICLMEAEALEVMLDRIGEKK